MNGPCKIFQTDNGLEFNNLELKIYLENLNIDYIRSAPYHPQSNGCCETLHKEIKNFLLNEKKIKKDKFDIDIAIEDTIEFHNYKKHSSTSFEPDYLRNIDDNIIIDMVINNIINSMKSKLDKFKKLPKFTMLLICEDIVKKGKFYGLKQNKLKKNLQYLHYF